MDSPRTFAHRKPRSQTWRTFLQNHSKTLVSVDFFIVPTIRFQVLYVFLLLPMSAAGFCISASLPTPLRNGPPSNSATHSRGTPRHNTSCAIRDRIFGAEFTKQVKDMGIQEVLSAPRSPWQRAYIERLIGTLRPECLDHVIVFNEASLYRNVKSFIPYYHESRTHLSLGKDTPEARPVQRPELGRVVAIPQVCGLHYRYERRAA